MHSHASTSSHKMIYTPLGYAIHDAASPPFHGNENLKLHSESVHCDAAENHTITSYGSTGGTACNISLADDHILPPAGGIARSRDSPARPRPCSSSFKLVARGAISGPWSIIIWQSCHQRKDTSTRSYTYARGKLSANRIAAAQRTPDAGQLSSKHDMGFIWCPVYCMMCLKIRPSFSMALSSAHFVVTK